MGGIKFADKAKDLELPERGRIAQLVVDMFPVAGTKGRSRGRQPDRALRAAILMFLAEHPEAPTAQLVHHFHGATEVNQEYTRLVARMSRILQSLRELGLVASDCEPRFVPRSHFGAKWGGGGAGAIIMEHTARWTLGSAVTAVVEAA